jgi:hypothetical protein
MARVSEDPELGCAAAGRGAGPESAIQWEDDPDGGAQQVGSVRPGYGRHGSRPDRDASSVDILVRRAVEDGAGFRSHRPPGKFALRGPAIARGVGASALAVVLGGLRRSPRRAGGIHLVDGTGLRGGGSFVNVGAGLADRLGGVGPDGGYPSDRNGDSAARMGARGEAGISCRRGGFGRRDRGRRRRPAHKPFMETIGEWHPGVRPCPAWARLDQSGVRAVALRLGYRFLRRRGRIAMLGLRRHRPGLGLPGGLHLVLPPPAPVPPGLAAAAARSRGHLAGQRGEDLCSW